MHERKPITIKELCDYLLATYPHDMRALTDAFEDGYNDPIVKKKRVYKRKAKYYWDGEYNDDPSKRDKGNFEAVIITGMRRSD